MNENISLSVCIHSESNPDLESQDKHASKWKKHNGLLVPKHTTALNLSSIFIRPSWSSWCPGERQDGKGEGDGNNSTYRASTVSVGLCFVSLTSVGRMYGDFHLTGDGWDVVRDMALSWSLEGTVLRLKSLESDRIWLKKVTLPLSVCSPWATHFSFWIKCPHLENADKTVPTPQGCCQATMR